MAYNIRLEIDFIDNIKFEDDFFNLKKLFSLYGIFKLNVDLENKKAVVENTMDDNQLKSCIKEINILFDENDNITNIEMFYESSMDESDVIDLFIGDNMKPIILIDNNITVEGFAGLMDIHVNEVIKMFLNWGVKVEKNQLMNTIYQSGITFVAKQFGHDIDFINDRINDRFTLSLPPLGDLKINPIEINDEPKSLLSSELIEFYRNWHDIYRNNKEDNTKKYSLDELLDIISKSGITSLSNTQKEQLDNYSKELN